MNKITITEAGRVLLDLDGPNHMSTSHFPTIKNHQHLATHFEENKTFIKNSSSKNKLDVVALRSILRDQTLVQLNKLKQHTQQRAYKYVKRELKKDITDSKQFLNAKADAMARKMLIQDKSCSNLQTEIGKAKNYLSKLIGDFQARKEEQERLRSRLKQKVKMIV